MQSDVFIEPGLRYYFCAGSLRWDRRETAVVCNPRWTPSRCLLMPPSGPLCHRPRSLGYRFNLKGTLGI